MEVFIWQLALEVALRLKQILFIHNLISKYYIKIFWLISFFQIFLAIKTASGNEAFALIPAARQQDQISRKRILLLDDGDVSNLEIFAKYALSLTGVRVDDFALLLVLCSVLLVPSIVLDAFSQHAHAEHEDDGVDCGEGCHGTDWRAAQNHDEQEVTV